MNLLEGYVAAGLDSETFWRVTPREVWAHFAGAKTRLEREFDVAAWAAWRPGSVEHGKKYPALGVFSGRKAKPARRKTVEEMEAVVRAWLGTKARGLDDV